MELQAYGPASGLFLPFKKNPGSKQVTAEEIKIQLKEHTEIMHWPNEHIFFSMPQWDHGIVYIKRMDDLINFLFAHKLTVFLNLSKIWQLTCATGSGWPLGVTLAGDGSVSSKARVTCVRDLSTDHQWRHLWSLSVGDLSRIIASNRNWRNCIRYLN